MYIFTLKYFNNIGRFDIKVIFHHCFCSAVLGNCFNQKLISTLKQLIKSDLIHVAFGKVDDEHADLVYKTS